MAPVESGERSPGGGRSRWYVGLLLLGVGLSFLYLIRSALPPFIIALFLALTLEPLVRFAERRHIPRGVAVVFIFLLLLLLLIGALIGLIPIVIQEVNDLVHNAPQYFQEARAWISRTLNTPWVQKIPGPIRERIGQEFQGLLSLFTKSLTSATGWLLGLLSRLLWLVIIPLATFYFMLDFPRMYQGLFSLLPQQHQKKGRRIVEEVFETFSAYIRGLILVSLLNGLTTMAVLWALKINYAFLLGSVAGLLYIVPYLGALVSVTLSAGVALFQYSASKALLVVLLMVLINQVLFDQIITPRVIGGQVGLHPLLSLFAMVSAGTLFGIWGIILAVPVTASLLIVLSHLIPEWIPSSSRPFQPPQKPARRR